MNPNPIVSPISRTESSPVLTPPEAAIWPDRPCKTAMKHLEAASPADPTASWIGAWMLLRRVRRIAWWSAALAALIIGVPCLWTDLSLLQAFYVAIGAGYAALSMGLYHIVARLVLKPPVEVPELRFLPKILAAMAPFDGAGREYLRQQGQML